MAEISSDFLYYSLVLSICFFASYLCRLISKKDKNPFPHHPPSPLALPIIGNLYLLGPVLPKSLRVLASKQGPLMRFHMGSSPWVIVSNATIAKELLKANESNFVSRPDFGASISEYNIYDGSKFFNAEYGPYWRFMKKLCMTELLSVQQINRFADIRREEMMKFLELLEKCSCREIACDVGTAIMSMANNVICRMSMSTRCSATEDQSKRIWDLLKDVSDLVAKLSVRQVLGPLGQFDLFGHGKKLRRLFLEFDELVEKIIVEREVNIGVGEKERRDLLDILLEVYRQENAAKVKLTRNDIKSFLLEIFMAGTETLGVAMQWTIAELINHPNIFQKLRDEIKSVVGSSNRLVEESDVPNLPYLRAVVTESLRLHPPAPLVFRKCSQNCRINGYDILANESVIFNLFAIMRDPNSWEDPMEFMPERFTDTGSSEDGYDHNNMDMKGLNFRLFPFGSGRRGCPGASLALSVFFVAIALVVQCFDFKVAGGEKISTEEGGGFSAGMAHPLLCYPVMNVDVMNHLPATAK